MALTKWISSAIVLHWKLLPILAMLLFWAFFAGFRLILERREQKLVREALLCLFCFGLGLALLCFGTYALVDPANGLAKAGAAPTSAAALARFEWVAYASLGAALLAGIALEFSLRKQKSPWPN